MQISEYFYSIQGEGTHAGKATIFIRFAFCDLSCSFCDEDKHSQVKYEWDFQDLLQAIKPFASRNICLTGGEPSLEDRKEVIWELQRAGYFVTVETNGYNPDHISNADWKTYSPKDWEQIKFGDWFDELKLIINKNKDFEELIKIASKVEQPIFLQPQTCKDEAESLANVHGVRDLILKEPRFRLSLQVQHYIRIQ